MADSKKEKEAPTDKQDLTKEDSSKKFEPEKDLFVWSAPSRPFKKRDKEFWITIIAIAVIFGLILFFAEGVMPVVLIISLIFLFYVLNTVVPETVEYKLTNRGIKIADKGNDWEIVRQYWFGRRFDSELLILQMAVFPGRLELVINPKDKETIKKVMNKYALEQEIPPSRLDRLTNWFSKKMPGNS